ncbi:DUF305 domain-containing protein [Arthrobacter sp. Sa2BUA2]|uniref:DUF305 domain-containing protein n=1 Tax=Arthrobacter pullicola TaxID=2762224 RepID=A0ABR8YLH1_9MICC|nr:DUF305 domain-containing protein [Arthrobacter pullicola]MBD8045063.1 DUF305 domain-containing protein [Arthrobacter pullicola]
MKKKLAPVSATALAAAIALAGCGATSSAPESSPASESTMPGMDHHGSGEPSDTLAADHNSADTMFAQMMIPHHEQAVTMSAMMLAKEGLDPKVVELAENITAAQGPEIEKMDSWLTAWDEPREMLGHSMEMDGMLADEDLAALESAQGTEAAKLFLTQMIEHHEGAVKMAEEEAASGSNPTAVKLAEDIIASQNTEIFEMQTLLQGLA